MIDALGRHLSVLRESLRAEKAAGNRTQSIDNPDFLPAALEIVERPPSPVGRAVFWIIIAFLCLALAWSIIGRIDTVASASGKLEPRGRVKVIQAAGLGVVKAIHVSDGEEVLAGQSLLELDPTVSGAEVEQARQSLLTAEVDVARMSALAAYIEGRSAVLAPPPGLAQAELRLQQDLIRARIRQHEASAAGLSQELRQRQGDVAMVAAEVRKLDEQLPLASDQLASLARLQEQGYAPRLRVDEVRERVVGLRQDLEIRREEQGRALAGQRAAAEEINKLRGDFAREVFDALAEAMATRNLRAEELKKAEENARLTVIRAPEAGVVQQLQANTPGGVVEPAAPLMVLVPAAGELVVEARLLNRDVGFVHEGQPVEVKIEAYPFTRYGIVEGVVEHVGRDAVEDEDLGLLFPVRVRLSQSWIKVGPRRAALAPGMAVTAEIKTGRRRVIEFLLSPLQRRVSEAGRER